MEAGVKNQALTQSIDILPTILEMLDIPIPNSAEGKSLVPLIENKKSEINDLVYSIWTYKSSVRSNEWKFILQDFRERELFYIPSDPEEKKNIAKERSDIADFLESKLMEWRGGMVVPTESQFLFDVDNETNFIVQQIKSFLCIGFVVEFKSISTGFQHRVEDNFRVATNV